MSRQQCWRLFKVITSPIWFPLLSAGIVVLLLLWFLINYFIVEPIVNGYNYVKTGEKKT